MRYLRVKNWGEFQHYRDRNPPWIKLHRSLLDDFEFAQLPDETKAHLVLIWLFASQSGGRIPAERTFLSSKLGARKPVDLKLLIATGFLIEEQSASSLASTDASNSASTPLAACEQDASTSLALARSREERREQIPQRTKAGEADARARDAGPTEEHRRLASELRLDCEAEWADFWDKVAAKGAAWFKHANPAFSNWLRQARKFADERSGRRSVGDELAARKLQGARNMDVLTGKVRDGRERIVEGTAERVDRAAVFALPGGVREPDGDDVEGGKPERSASAMVR